jgi:hypothetical protein
LQLRRPPPLVGALSAAGLLTARPDSIAEALTDSTFAFLSEVLLAPDARQEQPL